MNLKLTKIYFSVQDYLMILFGTLLYGFGFNAFILSNEIVTGGVSGICALIFFASNGLIPVSVSYFVINVALLVVALKILGLKFLIKTIFGVFSLSASLSLFEWLLKGQPILHDQPFMAIIIGAFMCGAGLGLVFSANGSTGGTDIIGAVINKYKNISIGRILLFCDFFIISSSFFLFHNVDSETVIGFLRHYGLDKDFALNIEVNHATLAGHTFEHELQAAADAGMLCSIDANRGDYQNGWDTDQFPMDIYELAQAWLVILEGGGLTTGGTNFDAKTRRNSTDLEDIFIAHIGGMDAFARALMIAADILENSDYRKMRAERYASFDAGEGKAFEDGKLTLEDLRTIALRDGEPKQISGKQELYEMIVNLHI